MTDLGTDLATLADGDLDPNLDRLVDGPALVAQDLRAELLTQAGALFYDASYGFDVRSLLAVRLTDARRAAVAARIEALCMRDERVAAVNVAVTDSLTIAVDGITSTSEPFRFVVDASAAPARLTETA